MPGLEWYLLKCEANNKEVRENGTKEQYERYKSAASRESQSAGKASLSFLKTAASAGTGNVTDTITGAKDTISNFKDVSDAMSEQYEVLSEVRKNKS